MTGAPILITAAALQWLSAHSATVMVAVMSLLIAATWCSIFAIVFLGAARRDREVRDERAVCMALLAGPLTTRALATRIGAAQLIDTLARLELRGMVEARWLEEHGGRVRVYALGGGE